jgi:hypothetical protein
MADHQNLHTGEKPHVCKICGFAAAAYTRLKVSTRYLPYQLDEF